MIGFPSGVVTMFRVSWVMDVAILGGFEFAFFGSDDSRDVLLFNKFTQYGLWVIESVETRERDIFILTYLRVAQ